MHPGDHFLECDTMKNEENWWFHWDRLSKLRCVFPMVILSILPHAEFGWNDHRESAPHFIICERYRQGVSVLPVPIWSSILKFRITLCNLNKFSVLPVSIGDPELQCNLSRSGHRGTVSPGNPIVKLGTWWPQTYLCIDKKWKKKCQLIEFHFSLIVWFNNNHRKLQFIRFLTKDIKN